MALPKSLTTVTPFSKALALFLFVALPLFFFWLGLHITKTYTAVTKNPSPSMSIPTPSQDMTPYWDTYVSPSLDVSFKHPPRWKVNERTTNNNTVIEIFDPADPNNSEITIQQEKNYQTLYDVQTEFYNKNIVGEWYSINGFNVFSPDNTDETFIANKEEIISIKAQHDTTGTYHQVVTSFMFISQKAGWRKYEQDGFMFYHPKDWYIENTSGVKSLPHGYANEMTVLTNPTQFTHYTSLDKCSEETDSSKICLDIIENIFVNGNSANSFYLNGQGDLDEHVVQIEGKNGQKAELHTSVFIEGSDLFFNQILSTFTFTN